MRTNYSNQQLEQGVPLARRWSKRSVTSLKLATMRNDFDIAARRWPRLFIRSPVPSGDDCGDHSLSYHSYFCDSSLKQG